MVGPVRAGLATFLVAFAVAAPARAEVTLFADGTERRGSIRLTIETSIDVTRVTVLERGRRLTSLPVRFAREDPYRGLVNAAHHRVPWRCDRRNRVFTVRGGGDSVSFGLRTPSCRHRLSLAAPARARRGRVVAVQVRDTWEGGPPARPLMCVRPPRKPMRCRTVRTGAHRLRLQRRGRWRILVRAPRQRLAEAIAVGVPVRRAQRRPRPRILVTGDSMTQNLDTALDDALVRQADVVGEVRLSTGLAKPGFSWPRFARTQVARHRPAATVVALGTNDGYDMDPIACCGPLWIAEYARRARTLMRIYGRVIWMTVPAARDTRRAGFTDAINAALVRAARGRPGVTLLRADRLLTPGGRFQDALRVDGRRVQVREQDGVHLSIAGARLMAQVAVRRLRAMGAVRR